MTETPPEPSALFAGSKIKLQRARGFLAELREVIDRHEREQPIEIINLTMGQSVDFDIHVPGTGLLLGAIIGDIVHNLRSALDLMASELARLNDRSDKEVYFPFSDGPETLDAAIIKKCFRKAGEDAVALLREYAPYRGGNEHLRAIHDLDVQDKHSALLVAAGTFGVGISISTKDGKLGEPRMTTAERTYKFPGDSPLAEMPIFETLEDCVELVAGIIEAFASMVALRNA
jgi:hypothetical protein